MEQLHPSPNGKNSKRASLIESVGIWNFVGNFVLISSILSIEEN